MKVKVVYWCSLVLVSVFGAQVAAIADFDPENMQDAVVAYRLPLIRIPFLRQPPDIDGTIREPEWNEAALLAGIHTQAGYLGGSGIMHPDLAFTWIGYDEEALYVAFDTERPADARQPKTDYVSQADLSNEGEIWKDDHVELLLQPAGRKENYHLAVNAAGEHGDGILIRSTDRSWNGQWQSSARRTDRGWQFEVRIPFETLETNTPDPGQMWRFLVLRARKTPGKGLAALSYLTQWSQPDQYARIVFGDRDEPAVRIPHFGTIGLDDVGLNIEITETQQELEYLVEATVYAKRDDVITFAGENKLDKQEDILIPITVDWAFYQKFLPEGWQAALETTSKVKSWNERIRMTPGESWQANWSVPVPEGKYLCIYSVRDVNTGQLVTARAMPFEKKNPLQMEIQPWVLMAHKIRVEVQYDMRLVNDPAMSMQMQVTDSATDQKIYKQTALVNLQSQYNEFVLDSTRYLGRKLTFTANLIGVDGELISQVDQTVQVPDIPDWFGNEYGISDQVPEPWKPIRLLGNQAEVLLRTYTIAENGLPERIVSMNKELLAGPVELLFDNKTLSWKSSIVKEEPGVVVWKSTSRADGCDVELISTLEFDGMIRYDLTLNPLPGCADVRGLELVIPYRKDRNIEKLPIVHHEFEPLVEVGDYETGLCWAAESWKGWQPGNKPIIEIQPKGEMLDWRIRFFGDHGHRLLEPLTITWMLQALPVKPWNTTYRDLRVVKYLGSEPDYSAPEVLPDTMTENSLTYPLDKNVVSREGGITFHMIPGDTLNLPQIQVLQIPSPGKSLVLQYERRRRKGDSWPYKQSIALYHGNTEIARVFPVMRQLSTPWLPVGLSWQTFGDETKITLLTCNSHGSLVTAQGTIPKTPWAKLFHASQIIFGGKQTLALDDVGISRSPLNPTNFTANMSEPTRQESSVLLLDSLDRLRFWRGRYLTCPEKISNGHGGIVGAPLVGPFVEKIDGRFGKAVLLLAGLQRTSFDYAEALGSRLFFPNQGQWQAMCGYYSPTFVPDPILKKRWRTLLDSGFGVIAYTGFAFDPELDPLIGPYMSEIARRPIVKIYTGHIPCRATPAVEYYTWGLKQALDYYAIQGLHLDGTWDCKNVCMGRACGCQWTDPEGNVQGRHTIFANREFAKRFYHLMKVYRKQKYGEVGYIGLHSGAAEFPMVSGFADICKHGEGGMFTSSDFARKPMLPEEFSLLISSRRAGIPTEILTKDENMPYGPNYLYLYTLLFDMGLRNKDFHLYPEYWHMDIDSPKPIVQLRDSPRTDLPPFNPYGAEVGISGYPLPTALLWMLMDDFGCESAEFLPFWKTTQVIRPDHERVRCAAWLHQGRSLLVIVSRFTGKPITVALDVDWDAVGLDSRDIAVFDGLTGEEYSWNSNGIHVRIDNGPYRLVRIESMP